MFNVYLRKINVPFTSIDSRNTGYGQTVSVSSTPTEIVFSSGITGQTSTWVGGMIIFTSGLYAGMAADIGGENKTGTTLDSVLLSQEFPSTPAAGTSFILYKKGSGSVTYDSKIYQITRHLESVKFDTVIDGGYDVCTLTVNGDLSKSLNQYSEILNMDVIVEDQYGHRCFRGLVASMNLSSNGGTIDCVGYYRTFGWFDFGTVYGGTADVTSPAIIKDICDANPYIANSGAIDRDGAWDTAQQAFGGIGPINFSESILSGMDALKRILELGRLGVSVEAVYLAMYNEPVPQLRYTSADIQTSDFVLTRGNYSFSQSGFNVKGSISDTYSVVSATYSDANNETFLTPYATNIRLLERFGKRHHTVQSNSQSGVFESTAVVQQANNDFQSLMSSDQYTVSGYVYRGGMNTRVPVYHIRAGDTVKVETPYGFENIYKNASMNAIEFYVGKTSYDSNSGVMTITPVNDPKKSEIFAARLKI